MLGPLGVVAETLQLRRQSLPPLRCQPQILEASGDPMKKFYTQVTEIYEKVARVLPSFEGNPCGQCKSCCQATYITRHQVSELELATMEQHLGKERVALFRRYIAREQDPSGRLRFEDCPMLDEKGCSIHPYRPMSCRLYGHFRSDDTELISHCVFRGKEMVIPKAELRRHQPGLSELNELAAEYASHFPAQSIETKNLQENPHGDLADRASYLLAHQRHREALEILEPLIKQDDSPSVRLLLGLAYDGLGDYAKAAAAYRFALEVSPSNPQLHLYLGSSLYYSGKNQEAKEAFSTAVDLAPEHQMAVGFLGLSNFALGCFDEARRAFARAVQLEDEPSLFRFQLGQACERCGRPDDAVMAYTMALEHSSSREMAQQALSRLQPS